MTLDLYRKRPGRRCLGETGYAEAEPIRIESQEGSRPEFASAIAYCVFNRNRDTSRRKCCYRKKRDTYCLWTAWQLP